MRTATPLGSGVVVPAKRPFRRPSLYRVLAFVPSWLVLRLFWVSEVTSEKERNDFRTIWTQVWRGEGYANANANESLEAIEAHYDSFAPHATDLLLRFLWAPIGTLRLIWGSPAGTPVLNDFAVEKRWEGQVVEFTLLTVLPQWRGLKHLPAFLLMREGYRRATPSGVCGIVMAADRRIFSLLRRVGMPLEQIGDPKLYEGSLTYPAFVPLPEGAEEFRKRNPKVANFFLS